MITSPNGNYAPRVLAKEPDAKDFTKDDFEKAMIALRAENRIRMTPWRNGQRKRDERLGLYDAANDFEGDGDE